MNSLQLIWRDIRNLFNKTRGKRLFAIDVESLQSLRLIARDEGVGPDEVVTRLVRSAVKEHSLEFLVRERWKTLTPREKQVTALICKGYTSRQVASVLKISPTTVKTHAENAMRKFGVSSRESLRQMLAGWNIIPYD